ncbi:MAG: arginine--tRNA ligase [Clostridia bacterium]
MEEIKQKIAKDILDILDIQSISAGEIFDKIEQPKDNKNGDFSYPCFSLAKVMKNSPANIAKYILEKMQVDENISKVEAINGFLNFYLNSQNIVGKVLDKVFHEKENYGASNEGNNKTIVFDYSSPNIAKPFHLGHFRNTVLGGAMYKLYQKLGYNCIGINYIGDWGRQFGLIIEGYNRFKDEYDFEKSPINALADIYARISTLAKEDEKVMDIARENFKKLEQGDKELYKKWEYFREVSLKEYNRIYDMLGYKFDSYNGEAFYNDKMGEVVDILKEKGVLIESQGAQVVNVGENMPPCIVLKSNGSTIYATRDLAAILYRARTYNFTKAIYVTGSEQILHFKQVFEAAKYLVDEKYQKGLVHVPYGLVKLKTGKMSSRDGNVVYIEDLIKDAVQKASQIIEAKNSNLENKEIVSKQVGIGALIFNYLKSTKLKDIIFDLDDTLKFDGETGPYVQYTYVRTQSILKKANFDISKIKSQNIDYGMLSNECEIELIKKIEKFPEIIKTAANEYEPSILTRYIVDIASLFSKFYNDCMVIEEEESLKQVRCILVYATSIVLKNGLSILGIECPNKM